MDTITIDEFGKVEIRVGEVIQAINVEESEKLIRFTVNFGDDDTRMIFTGVRTYGYTPDFFLNKKFLFVTNLEPKKIMSEESQGMILAVDGADKPVFVECADLPLGSKVR